MRIDRGPGSPSLDNPIDPTPQRVHPLRGRRAADWINRLGRPAPSICVPLQLGCFLLKELPGFAGFGGIIRASDMVEQSHPKRGERFVIKAFHAMVRGEIENFFAHSFERRVRRQLRQITHRYGNVCDVRELRRRNGRVLKRIDQCRDFRVARKSLRLQITKLAASIHLLPNEKQKHRANDRHNESRRVE